MIRLQRPSLAWIAGSIGALLVGLLAGPVALFWASGKLVGEYADPGGLLALWSSIYGDAFRLRAAGLIFLLGPLAMFQVAWAAGAALRKLRR